MNKKRISKMITSASEKSGYTVYVPKSVRKKPKVDPIEQEEAYVAFLKKKLASENYKASASKEEYDKEKRKYDKAKLKLKFLKEKK